MKIGVAFEGGGIKGAYEIGAYYALKKCGIKIDGFVGTSIGSFNALLLACGKEKELLNFWYNLDSGKIFGASENLINALNGEKLDVIGLFKGTFSSLKKWILGHGIDTEPMINKLKELVTEDDLKKSKKDFGLVTVKAHNLTPLYIFKEDIKDGKLYEYVMASCYLPVFKMKKIIDDEIYIDGGFFDNCPVNMLIDKGYKKIYAIRVNGIGVNQKVKSSDVEIITIKPSRRNCMALEMNKKAIKESIMMGFYDTLKVVKKYDGYKYLFKVKSDKYYHRLRRKVSEREFRRVKNFFKCETEKETIIKAVEYMAEKKYLSYYKVYNLYGLVRKIKKMDYKDQFIYNFVKKLRLF